MTPPKDQPVVCQKHTVPKTLLKAEVFKANYFVLLGIFSLDLYFRIHATPCLSTFSEF